MTTIAHCTNEAEALLLRSLLEASGIEVFQPEGMTMLSGMNYAGSGLRLQVNDEDAEEAHRIIKQAETSDESSAAEEAEEAEEKK